MEQSFKQLHSLCKPRKLKQEDIAKMAGTSREMYLHVESGHADPRPSTLMAVAGALELGVVLMSREVTAEVEHMITNHPTQPAQMGGGKAETDRERSERDSMDGMGGSHGLAGQYHGPRRHP